jgi:acetate---CoA ligase (ADP-forming)
VELGVLAIAEEGVEAAIDECASKGIRGLTIITAGFGEAVEGGRARELELARRARARGIRILGPNVSGTFNVYARFNASPADREHLCPSPVAGVCQGGYAVYDLLAAACGRGLGMGKFIHTGNECDLQAADFLEHFGQDPQVQGIVMYLETVRDGRRFFEIARGVAEKKPVIIRKVGRTPGGARAAQSHTGAIAGPAEIYEAAWEQMNAIPCPSMEMLFPLGHALVERPPMRGRRVGIITMGGSWGVALTDRLEEEGLRVPEFSGPAQAEIRALGMPSRASTRNPVDIGAAGVGSLSVTTLVEIGRRMLSGGEIDALIFHGFGRPGFVREDSPPWKTLFVQIEEEVLRSFDRLQREYRMPVILGCCLSGWESQAVSDVQREGIRVIHRLDEMAQTLSRMYRYWRRRSGTSP